MAESSSFWAKMPNAWIREDGLRHFTETDKEGKPSRAELNISISCLKTYIAICTRTDYHTGVARTTYDEICKLTGQSRSVVSRSFSLLEAHKLISCHSPNPKSGTYITVSRWLTEVGFAKIPKRWLLSARERTGGVVSPKGVLLKLRQFKFDNRLSLIALKVYLVLLSYRGSGTGVGDGLAIISYTRISQVAFIGRHQVSDAVTKLLEMNLITFRTGDHTQPESADFNRTNRYLVKGLNVQWPKGESGESTEDRRSGSKPKRASKAEVEATHKLIRPTVSS